MSYTVILLVVTFLASLGGLLLFVWSMSSGLFGSAVAASRVIFGEKEVGLTEEPASRTAQAQDDLQDTMNRTGHTGEFSVLSLQEAHERTEQDASGKWPVLLSIGFAVFWLVAASAFGLMASIKLHVPDFLSQQSWLTFGRIRPAHLNAVAYGWCSSAAFGVALWLMPRLLRTPLVGGRTAAVGAALWGIGVTAGITAVLTGHSAGLEWLEFPWPCDVPMVIGVTMMGVALLRTLRNRRVEHLYVSVWYIAAGLVWLSFAPSDATFIAHLLAPTIVIGIGLGGAFVAGTELAVTGVSDGQAGLASGLVNTSQQIGGAIGLAVLSTVAATRTESLLAVGSPVDAALTSGFSWTFLGAATLALQSKATSSCGSSCWLKGLT